VVTQPDREKGRGRRTVISPVKELALQCGLALFQPEKVKEEAFQEAVKGLHPDLFVVVAYGQIFPKSVLTFQNMECQCPCLLLPDIGELLHCLGNPEGEMTGVTTMVMDEGMDTETSSYRRRFQW
jgi:methionyl-tRNA formyltransferase